MITKMKNMTIVQEFDSVICKCEVFAGDIRTNEKVHITMYFSLMEQDQLPKPIAEGILKKLGYYFYGFDSEPETMPMPYDAELMSKVGQAQESETAS